VDGDRVPWPPDEDLLVAVANGDSRAFRDLYDRHATWLLLRLSRRFGDPTVIDEVVQDTFLAVWQGAARYSGRGEVAAWIWGIGVRRLVDRLRRAHTVVPLDVSPPEPSAEDSVLVGIEHGDLGGAIERLSPELRAVIQATVLDGLTTREAGQLLGVPLGTVKTRLMRARRELREALA
jgi:RNA polymerase sigma-70 factor, ECF subfamily